MDFIYKPYSIFSWDQALMSKKLELSDFEKKITCKEGSGSFKSAFSNVAFSDTLDGWAYYNYGALRHNSGGDGPNYGENYGPGDVIGVLLDTKKGTLSFSKNGKQFGVAFEEQILFTDGQLYAAATVLLQGESLMISLPCPED